MGKLLRGSGPDDALIESGVFGPGVIESVLNGSHYVRALIGMLIVEDLIRSLQWQAFWHQSYISSAGAGEDIAKHAGCKQTLPRAG